MRRILLFSAVCLAVCFAISACGDDGTTPPLACEGPNGPCIEIMPGPDVQVEAQTALIEAVPGDIIFFHAGIYEFQSDLSLDVDGVTVRGAGMDATMLSFAGQVSGAQGMLVTADDFIIEDLAIEDAAGDGLKVEGTTGVTIRRVRAEWTNGPNQDNGAYGLYPVQCSDVLIEDSVAIAAADAGIYVGQSQNIIVRRSRAEYNVAGIEIENSTGADVYENVATHNTGGLLVFSLPGLQVANGAGTRVYNNQIVDNNTDNFAPPGNIVGLIPRGTGIAILAGHEIEIFDNDISVHDTVNLGMISYLTTGNSYDDPDYNPFSDTIHIHDNVFGAGGEMPNGALGAIVSQALMTVMDPVIVPSVLFDGFIDPDKADPNDPRLFLPEYNICMQNNGEATFANVDFPNNSQQIDLVGTVHDCAHAPLPEVVIAGAGG
jgi:parallel beta-helix repeat protein